MANGQTTPAAPAADQQATPATPAAANNSKDIGRWLLWFAAGTALVTFAMRRDFGALTPLEELADYGSHISTLLLGSAILERVLDVVLSMQFGSRADTLDAEIRAIDDELAATGANALAPAEGKLREDRRRALLTERMAVKNDTRKWSVPLAVILGLGMSAVGFRSLGPMFQMPTGDQKGWFQSVDVVVTGLLLAGGSDGLHSFVALFRRFADERRTKTT